MGSQRVGYDGVTLTFTFHTVLCSGCTSLHSHQQCKIPFLHTLSSIYFFVDFLKMAILTVAQIMNSLLPNSDLN